MEKSENLDLLAAAMVKFQGIMKQPQLNKVVAVATRNGGKYEFRYADLSECRKAVLPALCECGLSVTQHLEDDRLATILMHASGQYICSHCCLSIQGSPQEIGSYITYMKRYSFCAILGIVADIDDDGNIASGNDIESENPPKKSSALDAIKKQIAQITKFQDLEALYYAHPELHNNAAFMSALSTRKSEIS